MNQVEMIIDYINENGSITTMQAFNELGVTRLASRISDIKKSGHEVQSETVAGKNRYGKPVYFKRYWF